MGKTLELLKQYKEKVKFIVPPEVKTILNISEEDLESFFDESLHLSPENILSAIEDIILNAYEDSENFRKVVKEDIPDSFPKTTKIINTFLKFLKTHLPSEKSNAIKGDTFGLANRMVKTLLKDKIEREEKPKVVEPTIEDMTDAELSLFVLPGKSLDSIKLAPDIKWNDIKDNVLFFLNKLKDPNTNKTIKNEATKGLEEELKAAILAKFLNKIRDLKIKAYGKLSSVEEKWLGKDKKQLLSIAKAMAYKPAPKEDIIRKEDLLEVMNRTVNVLGELNQVINTFNNSRFKKVIDEYIEIIEDILPPTHLIDKHLTRIDNALAELNLTKIQKYIILNVDIKSLSYNDPIKAIKEEKELALKKIKDEEVEKRKAIEQIISQAEELEKKDISKIKKEIEDYLSLLEKYYKKIGELSRSKRIDKEEIVNKFLGYVTSFSVDFNRLSKEELFRARWKGLKGFLFRKETEYEKEAIDYPSILKKFKAVGILETYENLDEIINSEDKIPLIREKLLSILELKPNSPFNITKKDYTGNPLGGKGMSLDEAKDIVEQLRNLSKKLDMQKKYEEALDIIKELAILHGQVKGVKGAIKSASVVDITAANNETKVEEKVLTKDVGRGRPYKEPSEAGWLIYRERLTKAGKKALLSFFKEPTFVQDVVDEMVKAGLNNKLLYGAKDVPVDIDTVLEKILKKATGKKGDLENILGSKLMQEYNIKEEMKKINKEIEETEEEIKNLNNKIVETEEKYAPIIKKYTEFLENPIEGMVHFINKLRTQIKEKKEIEPPKVEREEPRPIFISRGNYQSILVNLANKYIAKVPTTIKKAFVNAQDVPSEAVKKYLKWIEDIKYLHSKIEREKSEYKRAELIIDYYNLMSSGISKLIDYLEYYKKVLEADKETIKNIEKFLDSEEAKKEKEEVLKRSKDTLNVLKKAFETQNKYYNYLETKNNINELRKIEQLVSKEVEKIKEDIRKKRIDTLYQVAISPELRPTREKAKEIIERAKEKEKTISGLIDKNTFKKNMLRLMEYRGKKYDFVSPKGEVYILPEERKKDLEKSLKEYEENLERIKDYVDYSTKKLAISRLEDKIESYRQTIEKIKREKIDVYEKLIQNMKFLEENKDKMSEEEYKGYMNEITKMLEGKELSIRQIESELNKEKKYIEEKEEEIRKLESELIPLKHQIEERKPSVNIKLEIQKIRSAIERLRGVDQPRSTKLLTDQEKYRALINNLRQLEELDKREIPVEKGSREEREFNAVKEELKEEIEKTKDKLKQLKIIKVAVEEKTQELSPYELALELKGVDPKTFFKELKKPKGWEIVEDFFERSRKEYKTLLELKNKKAPIKRNILENKLKSLKNVLVALQSYMNDPIIEIGTEKVSFRDIVQKFNDLLIEYGSTLRQLISRRDDASTRLLRLQQQKEYLDKFFDPKTGEFIGFSKEEIDNLKGLLLRMLYRELDMYWATEIGQRLSVFGERATEWYNNVYRTFKNLAHARSNRKLINLLNKYKQEVRTDLDDVINRVKSRELERRLEKIIKKYKELSIDALENYKKKREELYNELKEIGKDPNSDPRIKELDNKIEQLKKYGTDPTKSEAIQELLTKIQTLKKQEKQIDKIFKAMGEASVVSLQSEIEKEIYNKAKELSKDKPVEKTEKDINKEADKLVEKVTEEVEKNIDELITFSSIIEKIDDILTKGEQKLGIAKEKAKQANIYNKYHPDFNLKILYSDTIQNKISELLEEMILN